MKTKICTLPASRTETQPLGKNGYACLSNAAEKKADGTSAPTDIACTVHSSKVRCRRPSWLQPRSILSRGSIVLPCSHPGDAGSGDGGGDGGGLGGGGDGGGPGGGDALGSMRRHLGCLVTSPGSPYGMFGFASSPFKYSRVWSTAPGAPLLSSRMSHSFGLAFFTFSAGMT